jgi:hypothetical protein
MVPVPPLPAVAVADTLVPVQTAPAAGEGVSVPATGRATTVQLTWLEEEVEQPEPDAVLRLSIKLVPVTAAKLGTEDDHALQLEPLFVEYLYSSAVVPAPPLPAVMLTVSVCPEQTDAAAGLFVMAGATGCAVTVQLSMTVDEVVQPEPVAVRYVCISTEVCPVVVRPVPEV